MQQYKIAIQVGYLKYSRTNCAYDRYTERHGNASHNQHNCELCGT